MVCSCPCVVFELRPCFSPGIDVYSQRRQDTGPQSSPSVENSVPGAAPKARGPPRSFSDAQPDAVMINVPLPIRQLDAFIWCIVTKLYHGTWSKHDGSNLELNIVRCRSYNAWMTTHYKSLSWPNMTVESPMPALSWFPRSYPGGPSIIRSKSSTMSCLILRKTPLTQLD